MRWFNLLRHPTTPYGFRMLTPTQIAQFHQDGFLLLRQRVTPIQCARLRSVAEQQLRDAVPPLEYEAEVGYAGAPAARHAVGGDTVRRLRGAWARDACFQEWAADPSLAAELAQLFGEPVVLNLAHHNCVMTKHPAWSTATGWHRDIRYWSFSDSNLITVWLALGDENVDNGGLQLIPASHNWQVDPTQLDERDFLRPELARNAELVAQAVALSLHQGDVLLFHSSLFHAAGKNQSGERKLSVAFAYHGRRTRPLPGSRSAVAGEVDVTVAND